MLDGTEVYISDKKFGCRRIPTLEQTAMHQHKYQNVEQLARKSNAILLAVYVAELGINFKAVQLGNNFKITKLGKNFNIGYVTPCTPLPWPV